MNALLAALSQMNGAPEQNANAQQRAKIALALMPQQGVQMAGKVAVRQNPLSIVQAALAAHELGGALQQQQQAAQSQATGRSASMAYLAQALRQRGQGGAAALSPENLQPDTLAVPDVNY